jgi:hypothetical protein
MDFGTDLERLLRVLHQRHGMSLEDLEKIRGALRIYELPLLEALRTLMREDALFEQELPKFVPLIGWPRHSLCVRWMTRIHWRARLEKELALREAMSSRPLPLLLKGDPDAPPPLPPG